MQGVLDIQGVWGIQGVHCIQGAQGTQGIQGIHVIQRIGTLLATAAHDQFLFYIVQVTPLPPS